MTSEPTPALSDEPLDDDEEAILAVLDDQATPDQRRRIARDPALRARLDAQRRAAAALGTEVPTPAETDLASLRRAALDAAAGADEDEELIDADPHDDDEAPREVAATTEDDGDGASGGAARPVALASRRRRARRLPPLPAVAAVVLLLVAVGATLILTDPGSDPDASETAAEAPGQSAEADQADPGTDAAASGAPSTTAPGGPDVASSEGATDPRTGEALLPYDDEEELRRSLTAVDPFTLEPPGASTAADAAASVDEEALRCSVVLEASDPAVEPVQAARVVLLAGQRVLVLSNPVAATAEEPANTRLTVLEPTGCVPLFAVQR